jgi:hypothetical protein
MMRTMMNRSVVGISPAVEAYATPDRREQAMNDELESALFEPIVILPSQISVDAQWAGDTSGPIALMLAVLEEAARCIERGRRRRHPVVSKLAAEAEAWVRSDSRDWPFAFASICDALELDVDAARARFLGDGQNRTGRRTPVWHIARGHGRTSVCPTRTASRAA